MRRLLYLVLVFAITAGANAAIELSINGEPAPDTYTMNVSDIIVIDASSFDSVPALDNVYYTIVKCVRGPDVETVVINGQVVMEDRRMLTVDEDDLRQRISTRMPALYAEFRDYLTERKALLGS